VVGCLNNAMNYSYKIKIKVYTFISNVPNFQKSVFHTLRFPSFATLSVGEQQHEDEDECQAVVE